MKVKELIAALQNLDPEAVLVVTPADSGQVTGEVIDLLALESVPGQVCLLAATD